MSDVRIVTDSTVRFPTSDASQRLALTIAPLTIRSGSSTFQESPTTELSSFRGLFEDPRNPPLTEAPSIEQFAKIYSKLQQETDKILSIHASSGIFGTVANARQASQQFLGRCNIQVVDSQSISAGLGLMVQMAAATAARGESFEDLVRIVRGMVPRLYLVMYLDDMDYLQRSGLVSRSQAILGNMLGIIPFLTLEEGKLIPMEKVRNRTRAMEKLVEFVSEFSGADHLAILHGAEGPQEETRILAERLRVLYPNAPLSIIGYGPAVATLVGLDGLGVVVLETEEEIVG
jgi:DegV family protein with EDD domain